MLELQEIRIAPDPILRTPALDLKEPDKDLAEKLRLALPKTALGLAAPQIGTLGRAIVWRNDNEEEVLWNPVIEAAGEEELGEEGCLSLPGEIYEVWRYYEIILRARGEDWRPIRRKLEGMAARIIQHEVDHLDGILICDRGTRITRPEQ